MVDNLYINFGHVYVDHQPFVFDKCRGSFRARSSSEAGEAKADGGGNPGDVNKGGAGPLRIKNPPTNGTKNNANLAHAVPVPPKCAFCRQ